MNDPSHPDNTDPASESGDATTNEEGQQFRGSVRYEAELTRRQAIRDGWPMTKRWIATRLTDAACLLLYAVGSSVLGGAAAVAWRTWAGG